jgi:hypothetical protein
MKHAIGTALLLSAVALTSCQSGDVGKRSDYSDASFDPLRNKIIERAKFLRASDPQMTEEESMRQASQDLSAERRREDKKREAKEAQDKFEKDLAQSVEK